MNRDQFEFTWQNKFSDESSIKEYCGEIRYRLLWEIRYFLEDNFNLDLDDQAINSQFFKIYYEGGYRIHDIHTSFEKIKSYSLTDEEKSLILAGLYYLIACCELDNAFLNTFKFALENGLKRIIRSYTYKVEDNERRLAQDRSVDNIINTFSLEFK